MGNTSPIDIKHIARAFNYALGEDFLVYEKGGKTEISDGKTECTITAQRRPFVVNGVDSETMTLTLTFYVDISDKTARSKVINRIIALTGFKTYALSVGEKEYNMATYLNYEGGGTPLVDSSRFRQDVTLTGDILVTSVDGGGVFATDNLTYMRLSTEEDKSYIPATEIKTQLGYQSETTSVGNDITPDIVHTSQASILQITAIFLKRNIDRTLFKWCALAESSIDNFVYLTRVFAGEEIAEKQYKVISGTVVEPAGAFCSYQLNVQEVKNG